MTKKDAPLITMTVQQGRLVPTSEFDLELLNNWYEGATVNVEVTRMAVRSLERRYFAMLSKLLKEADTPWTNTNAAHEAMKLATGFVNYNKAWKPLSRSISSFDDAELSEFFELFCGIVQSRFGVDPDTLGREASESSGLSSSKVDEADDAPDVGPIPTDVGVPIPSTAIEPVRGGMPDAGGSIEATPRDLPPAEGDLSTEDWDWLKATARMLVAAVGNDPDILMRQKNAIKLHHTHPDISRKALDIAADIYKHLLAVCVEKDIKLLNLDWVAETAGCTVDDLRAEAR